MSDAVGDPDGGRTSDAAGDTDAGSTPDAGTPGTSGPPPQRSLAELKAQITKLAGHLNAGSYRWLVLIAEFDQREGWADGSTPSCAHWLAWKCGLSGGAAREEVRVARALERLPLISAAMARGALSYSKVRALTRVAIADNEDALLKIALHGTAHDVETLVRLYRRSNEEYELGREAMQQANRGASWYYDEDGSLVLRARLPAEAGALLVKALELASEEDRRPINDGTDVPAGTSEAPGGHDMPDMPEMAADRSEAPLAPKVAEPPTSSFQRRADALALFAETWLSHGDRSLDDDRAQIVIHVDRDALRDERSGRCEIEGGPAMAVTTARRMSCDATLLSIVEDGAGQPLDVGRKTRIIPPAIRRALRSRDPGCRFPGCTHTRFLDGHHIKHWIDGGETKLSNLMMLCRFHHRQVHEGRVRVRVLDDGALHFTGSHGQRFVVSEGVTGDADQLIGEHLSSGIAIDENTAVTHRFSERRDYGLALESLLMQHAHWQGESPDVPAGAPGPSVGGG